MLVSIIVPVYNAKEYLEQGVNSLLNQTYKDIEILLINDGATDGSDVLCDEISKRDSRVRVFHKENGGTHTARNLGIEKSNGEYIMFMDPDDWLDINTVATLVGKIDEYDFDVARFNFVREFNNLSSKKKNTLLKETVFLGKECEDICRMTVGLIGDELKNPESLNFLASVCFNIYKKSVITKNNIAFFNIREIGTFSDGLFNIEVYMHCNSFLFIDEGFYHYRKTNSSSATSNYRHNFLEKQNLLFSKIYDLINDGTIEYINEAYENRIAIGTMELCRNALKSNYSFGKKYREIKSVLKNKRHINALKKLNISHMPMKWKLYYLMIKTRFVPGVYLMTYAIQRLNNRG